MLFCNPKHTPHLLYKNWLCERGRERVKPSPGEIRIMLEIKRKEVEVAIDRGGGYMGRGIHFCEI